VNRLIRGIEQLVQKERPHQPGLAERATGSGGHRLQGETSALVFLGYNERFEKLREGCPDAFRPETLAKEFSEVAAAEGSCVREWLVRYLNVCSEEYYLWQAGHLTSEVWSIWRAESERMLRTTLYKSAWPELRAEYHSHPEFIEYVERVRESDPNT
jgi:hypothetical protein